MAGARRRGEDEVNRLAEFFESDAGYLSMSRLMMFIGALIASFVVVKLTVTSGMTEGYFGIFLAYCGGVYVGGKAIDMKSGKRGGGVT